MVVNTVKKRYNSQYKKIQVISKETKLEIFFFSHGLKAEETYYQNGLKHFEPITYYGSAEVFRETEYFQDIIVTEVFFYKSGDTT